MFTNPLKNKKLIILPSRGYRGTNIFFDMDIYLEHRMECVGINKKNDIFVSRNRLSKTEDSYRGQIFTNRPTWLSLGIKPEDEQRLFLDEAFLRNSKLIKETQEYLKSTRLDFHLYGYNQTKASQKVAIKLNIPYLANPHFAAQYGTKKGYHKLYKSYGIHVPKIFDISKSADITRSISHLKNNNFDTAVIKHNQSQGGIGHSLVNLHDTKSIALPEFFNFKEGGTIEGWFEHDLIKKFLSIDMFIDLDGTPHIVYAKTKIVDPQNPKTTHMYKPLDSSKPEIKSLINKLKKMYTKEKAYGSHCSNFIKLTKEGAQRYGYDENSYIMHDENTRIGGGLIAKTWAEHLKHKPSDFWQFKVYHLSKEATFGKVLDSMDNYNILETDRPTKTFVYNGTIIDRGLSDFNELCTVSTGKSPEEVEGRISTLDMAINNI